MNALWWRAHEGKFLFLFCFCFRFPGGLDISCSNSLVPWGSTQPLTGREGMEALSPMDRRRWTEAPLRLGCPLFSLLPTYITHMHWPHQCHTLTSGKIPFLTSFHHDLPLLAPYGIFNCLLSPGSPPSPCCQRMLEGWAEKSEVWVMGGLAGLGIKPDWKAIGSWVIQDFRLLDISSSWVLFW